jgi:hypothetical protein
MFIFSSSDWLQIVETMSRIVLRNRSFRSRMKRPNSRGPLALTNGWPKLVKSNYKTELNRIAAVSTNSRLSLFRLMMTLRTTTGATDTSCLYDTVFREIMLYILVLTRVPTNEVCFSQRNLDRCRNSVSDVMRLAYSVMSQRLEAFRRHSRSFSSSLSVS